MIEAAGGVVLRTRDGHTEVLVVHRMRYDDWSLPKGKLDPGESAVAAAVREVEEETGVHAAPIDELPELTYTVAAGPKRVRWFTMRFLSGDPADRPPDEEVDVARWVELQEAVDLLTYAHDVALLRHAVNGGPR